MTQLEFAKKNIITPLMKRISCSERLNPRIVKKGIREGRIVIPGNRLRRIKKPCAIGSMLRTKINVNIGTSTDKTAISEELKKLKMAIKYGADTIMDLSIGGDIRKLRRRILNESDVPVGTVPIYEIAVTAHAQRGDFLRFGVDDILDVLECQASEGVDFWTIHAGVTKKSLSILKNHKRILGIVSRGGAILARWIRRHNKENPFYEYFDKILDIAYKYDVTLSLGDGLRPGSILDATDAPQIAELKILGELAARAKEKNVGVIIEGPGHIPLNQIKENITLQKTICHNAPFYVLGPLVTDIAAGYDHINACIGAANAAAYGADFLCCVTPSEHLRHPSLEDVREGVVAFKIAAHAADIVKNAAFSLDWDRKMSEARKKWDWKKQIKFSIDPHKAKQYRFSSMPAKADVCTMCGEYCSIKMMG